MFCDSDRTVTDEHDKSHRGWILPRRLYERNSLSPSQKKKQHTHVSLLQAQSCLCHVCRRYGPRLHSCLHCVFFGCFEPNHIHEHAKSRKHCLGTCVSFFVDTEASSCFVFIVLCSILVGRIVRVFASFLVPEHQMQGSEGEGPCKFAPIVTQWNTLPIYVPCHAAMDLSYGAVYCFMCRDYVYDEDVEKATSEQTLTAAQSLGMLSSSVTTIQLQCHRAWLLDSTTGRTRDICVWCPDVLNNWM